MTANLTPMCANCAAWFEAKTTRQLYCSERCYKAVEWARRKARYSDQKQSTECDHGTLKQKILRNRPTLGRFTVQKIVDRFDAPQQTVYKVLSRLVKEKALYRHSVGCYDFTP